MAIQSADTHASRRTAFVLITSVLTLGALSSACERGPRCEWTEESPQLLNLTLAADQQQLRGDALLAETRSLRFADRKDEALGHREAAAGCEATLLDAIARAHHVSVDDVRRAMRRQNDLPF